MTTLDTQKDKAFRQSFRVYYEDTDAGGVVYYANYMRFAERARTEWLRQLGMTHAQMLRDDGLLFVVRHLEADYRASARLDDLLASETFLTHIGGASLDMCQILRQEERGSGEQPPVAGPLCKITVTLVAVAPDGKIVRLPQKMRDILQPLVVHDPLEKGAQGEGRQG